MKQSKVNELVSVVNNTGAQALVAGVDEAGRGPLCGPVIAAAVILDSNKKIKDLNDSKQLSEKKRNHLFSVIKNRALAWSLGRAEVAEIDQLNILNATLLAMKRAVEGLTVKPELVLVDGNRSPELFYRTESIVKGDSKFEAIAAASIIAKVSRDQEMVVLDKEWPGYHIADHKGYPTKTHLEALNRLGPSPIHRRSFKPVYNLLINNEKCMS